MRTLLSLILVLPCAAASWAQTSASAPTDALVRRALATELREARNPQHQMRYTLRKQSPRLITTKLICETKDGAVARLIAVNDRPLTQADEQKEQSRLNQLLADPGKQRRRKQSEDQDAARAMKVLRALQDAFVYQYAGSGTGATGTVEKFNFKPNPRFNPPDLETQALPAVSGEIWVDAAQERVTRLEAHVQQDVDFGWGLLGRLYKGGWLVIEQADVGEHQWRTVHFQMNMTGRVIWRTKVFDTTEDQGHYIPVPQEIGYRDAIQLLRSQPEPGQNESQ